MTCAIFFTVAVSLLQLRGTFATEETCTPKNVTYNIADEHQCDKYFACTKAGKLLERLCDDGFVFSKEISQCDYPHNVNCKGREQLQPSLSKDPNCPRSNGFYAFAPSDSCQKFYHCLEGVAYEKTCPEGVIFEPAKGTCMHPDLTRRPDCAAKEVLNFTCPNSVNRFMRLRFGDHDRFPHTGDCRKFFICLRDGRPRVGGCPLGRVFDGQKGFCSHPKKVKGCEDYYGSKSIEELIEESEVPSDFNFTNEVDLAEYFKNSNKTAKVLKDKTSPAASNSNNNNDKPLNKQGS